MTHHVLFMFCKDFISKKNQNLLGQLGHSHAQTTGQFRRLEHSIYFVTVGLNSPPIKGKRNLIEGEIFLVPRDCYCLANPTSSGMTRISFRRINEEVLVIPSIRDM